MNKELKKEAIEIFTTLDSVHSNIVFEYNGSAKDRIRLQKALLNTGCKAQALIDKATLAESERINKLLEPKSIAELESTMGEVYDSFTLQVSYKEGYNQKGKEIKAILNRQSNE